jgi:hypothetical protein
LVDIKSVLSHYINAESGTRSTSQSILASKRQRLPKLDMTIFA